MAHHKTCTSRRKLSPEANQDLGLVSVPAVETSATAQVAHNLHEVVQCGQLVGRRRASLGKSAPNVPLQVVRHGVVLCPPRRINMGAWVTKDQYVSPSHERLTIDGMFPPCNHRRPLSINAV